MTTEELKKEIEEIINETFTELSSMYKNKKADDSHIIFPKYRDGQIRVSEQELRCVFIQKLCKCKKELYYSVETPTNQKYKFTDKNKSRKNPEVGEGRSGCIDLSIYDSKYNLLCIVEFKAHGKTSDSDYKKDLLKLYAEPDVNLRYFIQVFERFNEKTLENVQDKLEKSSDYIIKKCKQDDAHIFAKVQCRFCILGNNGTSYKDSEIDYEILKNVIKHIIL